MLCILAPCSNSLTMKTKLLIYVLLENILIVEAKVCKTWRTISSYTVQSCISFTREKKLEYLKREESLLNTKWKVKEQNWFCSENLNSVSKGNFNKRIFRKDDIISLIEAKIWKYFKVVTPKEVEIKSLASRAKILLFQGSKISFLLSEKCQ